MQCKCGELLDYRDVRVVDINEVSLEVMFRCLFCNRTYSAFVQIKNFLYNEGSGDAEE